MAAVAGHVDAEHSLVDYGLPAVAGATAAGLLILGRGNSSARAAGAVAVGGATGAAAVPIVGSERFDDVRHHKWLRFGMTPAAAWAGVATVAALGGVHHLHRTRNFAKLIAREPRIDKPTKALVGAYVFMPHPFDYPVAVLAAASLARPRYRGVVREAWQVARPT